MADFCLRRKAAIGLTDESVCPTLLPRDLAGMWGRRFRLPTDHVAASRGVPLGLRPTGGDEDTGVGRTPWSAADALVGLRPKAGQGWRWTRGLAPPRRMRSHGAVLEMKEILHG
jgi:hypothetical protein